ncbi:Ctr copper transporter [Polyplosphaeria fusca]|uniref:Copper transport protein n=1 Tax=Polyplosphaeria fusca TaxID=682080 RepID=A0A9P4R7B5_9PLEO|nr:Ctr copper transporter [Polyplosphaeria fusca]
MNHGGNSESNECKVSMLWNYNTIDACFLSPSWQIKNSGMMAASCVGVVLLCVILEALRRIGKQYDQHLVAQCKRQAAVLVASANGSGDAEKNGSCQVPQRRNKFAFRVSAFQQLARAIIHAVTFGVAYVVMLLAMYFNAYIFFSIVIGAGLGKYLCDWMVVVVENGSEEAPKPAGIEESTVCCG